MKNKLFYLILGLFVFVACSDDDDVVTPPDGGPDAVENKVVLNEVRYQGTDLIEIFNEGDQEADLNDYWLCLGPGTYQRIGDLTPESGNIVIPSGGYLVLAYDLPDTDGGLGLYSTNTFGDSDAIVDFVQYGSGGSARENVAVAAGIWAAGEFVPTVSSTDNSIVFDGEGNGAANWAETTSVTFGQENVLTVPVEVRSVVFNEVQYGNRNLVELYNNGEATIDLSTYWLCLGPGTYVQIGDLTPESGNIELAAGELVVLPYDMPDDEGGLGLYSMNQFANPDAIMDFVQWGAGGSARENVAVSAGIWTAGDFVPTVRLNSYSIEYDGEGDTSADWSEEVNPSLGASNDVVSPTTTFSVTIKNAVNYLNVHTFTTPVGAGSPGPLTTNGAQYQISFQAVPGTKFTPVTMMGNSNDWFLAPTDLDGIDLFPNGQALNGVDIASQLSLYDLGSEADGDPSTFPPAGTNVGPADSNPLVRLVPGRGTGDIYMTAVLDYANGDGNSAGTFTLTITAINTPDPSMAASSNNGFVITPGIAVLHAQGEPLFTIGEEDRGVGLERIAEDGMPGELYNWFTEAGSQGAPLRLSSSLTPLSPAFIYAFNTDRDPWFTQGEAISTPNGLEEIAEDGNRMVAYNYMKDFGIPVALSAESGPIGPGGSYTFTIEVPQGQNYKFGFGTMLVESNDWVVSYNNAGFPLFLEDGSPYSGTDVSSKTYLYDAGTEDDEPVGFGPNQVRRQADVNTGPADANTTIRRVSALEDVQFGKGVINSGPGVTWSGDPRGGYNIIEINIQAQ
ncbi:spondin domain-containing protein [Aquimarina sp. 2201CG5-10]|uniref:spondin domain-containing protein n=1 Tax=Aquimarina callyspongiae TaxID=3098150 RepID=UPI002AB34327|nr:spondin domain-containing protein [Aquimarina sp. 2201CG5-10]MDY8138198.1 spondin domain-containing protein [Aquimarina sp. 2201CG5-10]